MTSVVDGQKTLSNSWTTLEKVLTNILSERPRYELYESAYYLVYRAVFFGEGQRLHKLLEVEIAKHLICQLQEKLRPLEANTLLAELAQMWTAYKGAVKLITKIFSYLDARFALENRLPDTKALCTELFRDKVVLAPAVEKKVEAALTLIIKRMRKGLNDEQEVLKECCQLLVEVDSGKGQVYESVFEDIFINKTREFYTLESKVLLQELSSSSYVAKIESIMDKELAMCRRAMDLSTLPRLTEVLHEVLISNQLQAFVEKDGSGVPWMLKNSDFSNLARVYRTLTKVAGGLQILANCISVYLRERGSRIVNEPEGTTTHGTYAITYVQKLIELREHMDQFLHLSFGDDLFLKRSSNLDFETFINSNLRSPEYLSLFIDEELKKSHLMCVEQMETEMAKALVIFRFLREKDMFERYYKQHLAKRLLLKKSANDDWELNMVNKLKVECGFSFVQHLEGMFKDMAFSAMLMDSFREGSGKIAQPIIPGLLRRSLQSDAPSKRSKSDFDMDVKVLSPKNWPLNFPPPACTLPPFAAEAFAKYEEFYLQNHQHRQLKINTLLGGAEIVAHFTEMVPGYWDLKGPRKYYLSVATQQMVILDLFNQCKQLSFKDLCEKTGLSEHDLIKNVTPMVFGKPNQQILSKSPAGRNVQTNDVFSVNESYHSKSLRVRLHPVASRVESVSERHKTRSLVEVDRKGELEAAVVRIMKDALRLHQNALIAKVIEQVKHRFAPTPGDIKKSIDALCSREFVGRSEDDRKMIEYKP